MDGLGFKGNLQLSYDRHAEGRNRVPKDDWKVAERDLFLSYMEKAGLRSILEIGAGTGQDSLFFIESELVTTATDLSGEMVRLCCKKGINAHQMDCYDLQFPNESFDAVWSLNCLLHVPKEDLGGVLAGIRRVLKSGGLFYLGVYGGQNSEGVWEDDSYQPKRFFSFHDDRAVQAAVSKYFDVLYFRSVDYGDDLLHFQSMILKRM